MIAHAQLRGWLISVGYAAADQMVPERKHRLTISRNESDGCRSRLRPCRKEAFACLGWMAYQQNS